MLPDLRMLAMPWLWLSVPMLNQEQWTTSLYTSSQRVPSYSVSFLPKPVKTLTTVPTMDPSDICFYKQTSSSLHMKEFACFISFWAYIWNHVKFYFWYINGSIWVSIFPLSPEFLYDTACQCGCLGTYMSTFIKAAAQWLPRHEHCLYVFKMT